MVFFRPKPRAKQARAEKKAAASKEAEQEPPKRDSEADLLKRFDVLANVRLGH